MGYVGRCYSGNKGRKKCEEGTVILGKSAEARKRGREREKEPNRTRRGGTNSVESGRTAAREKKLGSKTLWWFTVHHFPLSSAETDVLVRETMR